MNLDKTKFLPFSCNMSSLTDLNHTQSEKEIKYLAIHLDRYYGNKKKNKFATPLFWIWLRHSTNYGMKK